jgi:hypothetical protein
MPSSHETSHFGMQLLQQDKPFDDSEYKEYRMKLENALNTAERREKLAGRVGGVSIVVTFALMFAGGTRVFGSLDPWSTDATIVSVTLGAVYWIAVVAGAVGLASYYSRFRPRVREIKEQIRDTHLPALQCEIAELRKQIGAISRRNDPA